MKGDCEGSYYERIKQNLSAIRPLMHLMIGTLIHIMAVFLVAPALTDVVLEALCPGEAECTQAILLNGIQQVVAGVGTMFVTPVIGELSDEYGRKPMLMIPLVAAVLPNSILAYSRTKTFIYAHMAVGTVVRMVTDGGVICLVFAYVGDCVQERLRALAIGVLMGSLSLGYVIGILVARVLPVEQIFSVAAVLIASAAIYIKIFLPETNIQQPNKTRSTPLLMRSTSSISETALLFKHNKLLTQVAIIVFFYNLGEAGVQSSLLYYLKATFSFAKNQFAELMLISGVVAVFSQLFVMPFLVHFLSEKLVLCIGIFAAFSHALLYGVAWATWVPYFCSSLTIFSAFVFPCLASIVSKTASPEEQGRLQGFITGVKSLASIVSPLVISPLTALFLSDSAPFKLPGFSIICSASVMVIAVIQACLLEPIPPSLSSHKASKFTQVLCEESQEPLIVEPLLHPGP